ncbi:hypothetical protein IQ07DRAFT_287346 [Pyrenochaeta sp. DS3sAY3a]|nr:hypothetical protein IQ07DRAFT_287346 [Pyrenochaeta sp. DS3sAY3a]
MVWSLAIASKLLLHYSSSTLLLLLLFLFLSFLYPVAVHSLISPYRSIPFLFVPSRLFHTRETKVEVCLCIPFPLSAARIRLSLFLVSCFLFPVGERVCDDDVTCDMPVRPCYQGCAGLDGSFIYLRRLRPFVLFLSRCLPTWSSRVGIPLPCIVLSSFLFPLFSQFPATPFPFSSSSSRLPSQPATNPHPLPYIYPIPV